MASFFFWVRVQRRDTNYQAQAMGANDSRKETKTQRKPKPGCVMLGAELTLFFTPVFVVGEEKRPGIEVGQPSPFAVRQSLKFNVRDVVRRGTVGFAVGG